MASTTEDGMLETDFNGVRARCLAAYMHSVNPTFGAPPRRSVAKIAGAVLSWCAIIALVVIAVGLAQRL